MAVIFPNGNVEYEGVTIFRDYHVLGDDEYLDAIIYDPSTKEVKTVQLWTTAAACGAMPTVIEDAPEEAKEAFRKAIEEKEDEKFARKYPKLVANGHTRHDLTKIQLAYPLRSQSRTVEAIIALLATKTFKSEFRRSLAEQVREWLEGRNDYATPLSPRQAAKITF